MRIAALLTAPFLLTFAFVASAQQAEWTDAARIPSKPLRLEQPTPAAHETKLDPGVSDDSSRRTIRFTPQTATVFPLFLGAGAEVSYRGKLALGLNYGLTPKAYSKAIAEAAASIANEPSYRKVIEAAFQHNEMIRAYAEYRFRENGGFKIGSAYSQLSASGTAAIDDVLEQPTGILYTILKNLLLSQGKDPNVNMKSDLGIGELYVGYGWNLSRSFTLAFDLGVAKVFSSDIRLSTEAPSYDNSSQGRTQLRQSESDLEKIIRENGITPTLGLRAGYTF
jgi:hypothetical protein